MNAQQLEALTASYIQSGGKVKQCQEGDNALIFKPRDLWSCECGCHGDYTEHSMRAGESGRDPRVVIR